VANPARVWNYWLGGKDNFAADREAADKAMEAMPAMPLIARMARRFLGDAVRQLADGGIRQFLDIGTGLPTADNTHEVAQRAAPDSRIVYVDYDPVVLSHARALLTSTPEGATDYIQADLRDTGTILAQAAQTLDLSQPVALMLVAVLHFFPDTAGPAAIVARLLAALPPGSYLVASQTTADFHEARAAADGVEAVHQAGLQFQTRTADEFLKLAFTGLQLVDPGLVPVSEWRPDKALRPLPAEVGYYGAVARKP
jgi:O-methyltransferase involved in polyketide biosynthesis